MPSFQRPSLVESLEARRLMSGDVATALRGGDLILRGDADANQIVITQPSPATLRITGQGGTTVDGQPFVDVPTIADDLSILFTQGGEDQVAIQGPFTLPDDLRVRMRQGALLVEGSFGPVAIADDVTVRTGPDVAVTIRNEVRVGGDLTVKAGGEVQLVSAQASVPDYAAAQFTDSLTIDNPYFPLVAGSVYTYEADVIDDDTGETSTEQIVIEVLPDTRTILGVQVRVVRDRVYAEGRVIEDTFDWYAQDDNGNVWYFGENVTNFEYDDAGTLIETNSGGSWEAGVNDAQAGVLMEAVPRVGHRYHQEFSPGNVLDHGEGLATNETATVAIGTYNNVFRTEESSVVEPFGLANKLYAPGVGTIMEFDIDSEDDEITQTTRLVSLTLNGTPVTQVVSPTGFTGVNAADARIVGGIEIGGDAHVVTQGPLLFSGVEIGEDLHAGTKDEPIVVIDTVFGQDAELWNVDTITLRGVQADALVRVGGPSDVVVFDSDIAEMKGTFSRVDNAVVVRGSLFDLLEIDGGGGTNTFDDLGGNTFTELKLKRFTQV